MDPRPCSSCEAEQEHCPCLLCKDGQVEHPEGLSVCCRCDAQLPHEFITEAGYCKTCEIDYIKELEGN